MPIATLVLLFIAIALAAFGLMFVVAGRNGERGYWSQRDPSGDPSAEATPLRVIMTRTWSYAAGEVRAPLRLMAIGVILWWLAIASAVIAVLLLLVGS